MKNTQWRITHASAIGTAHINQGTECQDRFACQTIEKDGEEVLIAVVADGAGSTTDGQIGAEIACQFFIEEVTDFLNSQDAAVSSLNLEFGKFWISFVQQKINEVAEKKEKVIRDFASTLVGAVIGENHSAFFQIGDGGAVFSTSGLLESYQFAIAPEESEYVNVTQFLTDETALENLRFQSIEERIEDLILFSDGIYAVAVDYQTNQPHEPFLMPMIAPLRNGNGNNLNEKLESFLGSPKINEKTDDDKTIILATRK
ncbi:MAG: protein phosphatase 2C domain-containing protein [Pyrinomonadaceae bacterium]|nr:protein phosphatase 2C domain-containing protein [Pyrinomonadaceae bacterium]